jgi:SWI/SNF-related matrix-associated actin-dependent regulator of chromatin subfamily A member 5
MNFLIPDVFNSADPFDNWMANSEAEEDKGEAEKKNVQMITQLHKILKPFMLRRTKAEVEKTLPGKK